MKTKGRLYACAFGVTSVAFGAVAGGLLAQAATTAKPEIDRANANIQLGGTLKPVSCVGEDKTDYVTYLGSWSGGENQVLPDPTDYKLTGTLTVSNIQWTINLKTDRGVLVGAATLQAVAGGAPTYAGTLTLITQGNPASSTSPTTGRGWIDAPIKLPDEGALKNDDSLLANVEFPSLSTGGGAGWFGDLPGAPNVPDFSVVTNANNSNEAC
jgi:hypothetical protein